MDYSEEKATAVACAMLERAGGALEDLKLMKLMYLVERESIRLRNVGVTGDRFYSLRNGPVLSRTLDRMSPREQIDLAAIWREHIELPERWMIRLKKPFNLDLALSKREREIVDSIWTEHGSKTKWELVELTHGFAEWDDPGNSHQPIAFQDVLRGLGFDFEEIKRRYSEHRQAEDMERLLSGERAL